jgi:cytochrome c oxidase subunit 4
MPHPPAPHAAPRRSAAAEHAAADAFPDPARMTGHHHAHVIVPMRILVVVLAVLLLFTMMTVGAAQLEVWIAHTFDVVIPQWVNVAVALSIAFVKATIVALYFMQLRYDNPVNSLVVIFTLFTLVFFLGFTMIDLGSRTMLYDYKGQRASDAPAFIGNVPDPRVRGGTGNVAGVPALTSIATEARRRADARAEEAIKANRPLEKRDAVYLDRRLAELHAAGTPQSEWPEHYRAYAARRSFFAPGLPEPADAAGH